MSEIQRSVTSESLGPLMKQNPAALRRTMGGLRQAGIVRMKMSDHRYSLRSEALESLSELLGAYVKKTGDQS